jgi:NADH dehydrogenase
VIGDMASYQNGTERPLPGLAPVAMQQGKFVARVISERCRGGQPPTTFVYRDRGSMAVIGRCSAIAQLGHRQFSGFFAWLIWVSIHLIEIIQFRNRMIVTFQ